MWKINNAFDFDLPVCAFSVLGKVGVFRNFFFRSRDTQQSCFVYLGIVCDRCQVSETKMLLGYVVLVTFLEFKLSAKILRTLFLPSFTIFAIARIIDDVVYVFNVSEISFRSSMKSDVRRSSLPPQDRSRRPSSSFRRSFPLWNFARCSKRFRRSCMRLGEKFNGARQTYGLNVIEKVVSRPFRVARRTNYHKSYIIFIGAKAHTIQARRNGDLFCFFRRIRSSFVRTFFFFFFFFPFTHSAIFSTSHAVAHSVVRIASIVTTR